jgi:purine-binding chemotaxis protein CheW
MGDNQNVDDLYVVIGSGEQRFALPVEFVREMVPMPKVVEVPRTPPHVRGVINLRGRVLPLIDLRVRLGMVSCLDEAQSLVQMMSDREHDHRNWMDALQGCLEEDREFTLGRDPHKCKFGQWYYAYDPKTTTAHCLALDSVLIKFEDPHKRVHALADQLLNQAKDGDREGALAALEKARQTTMAEMIELFEQSRQVIGQARRELAVVLDNEKSAVALSVDLAESVERVTLDSSQDLSKVSQLGLDRGLITGFGRRKRDDSLIMLLDASDFLETANEMEQATALA